MKDSLQQNPSDAYSKDGKTNNLMENRTVTETKDFKDVHKTDTVNTETEENNEINLDNSNTTDDVSVHQDISEQDEQTEDLVSNQGNENTRLKEELLRLHADVDNTKKRLARLFEDKVRDKTVAILKDIIEHIDNFERAFDSHKQMTDNNTEAQQQNTDTNAIFDGFGIIKNQFLSTLQNNWGLNTIEALNKEFNPDEHEAIMQENSEKVKHPTVVQEFMKGYTYLGKVIRPAKVKVALPKE